MTIQEQEALIETLKERFEQNRHRHEMIEWTKVQEKLEANPDKIKVLQKMEETGGEPDVIRYDSVADVYIFYDCSRESPKGRRSVCYDQKALESRKSTNQKIAQSIWLLKWELNYSQRNNIKNYKKLKKWI